MGIVKTVLILLVSMSLITTTGCAGLGGGTGPTQKTLVISNLPPIIPIRDFFANQDAKWGYTLSDTGKWLAWWEVSGISTIMRYRLTDGGKIHQIKPVGDFSFVFNDSENVLYVVDRKGIWVIDADNPSKKWRKMAPRGIYDWRILRFPSADDPHWYFLSYNRSQSAPDIYRFDSLGENRRLIADNDGTIFNWYLSPQGDFTLRYRRLQNGATSIEVPDNGGWRVLLQVKADDQFTVVGHPQPGQAFWALSNRGRDKVAAVSVDPETGEEKIFYQNERVDLEYFAIDKKSQKPAFVVFSDPYFATKTFDSYYQKLYELISIEKRKTIRLLSETHDGKKFTIALSENEDAYRYYLIDAEKGTRQKIGTYAFAKYDEALSETEAITIPARDGLVLPSYLTRPKGAKSGPLPLVLLVHGGPAMRDYWNYNHEVQFLANRGYAVLRVNYRGSSGFGRRFQAAGFREMGQKMQDDLDDAVRWAIDQGIADPNHIAIMGSSYGGYAALTAAWRDNGLYKAAVAHAAVSDMLLQTENHPEFWALHLNSWTQYTGDPQSAKVRAHLKAISPVNHVKAFNIPLLLVHGKQDKIVNFQHSKTLANKLKAENKSHETLYLNLEDHGLSRWQSKIKFWRRVEEFLSKELGGRNGGFDYVEIGAAFL